MNLHDPDTLLTSLNLTLLLHKNRDSSFILKDICAHVLTKRLRDKFCA